MVEVELSSQQKKGRKPSVSVMGKKSCNSVAVNKHVDALAKSMAGEDVNATGEDAEETDEQRFVQLILREIRAGSFSISMASLFHQDGLAAKKAMSLGLEIFLALDTLPDIKLESLPEDAELENKAAFAKLLNPHLRAWPGSARALLCGETLLTAETEELIAQFLPTAVNVNADQKNPAGPAGSQIDRPAFVALWFLCRVEGLLTSHDPNACHVRAVVLEACRVYRQLAVSSKSISEDIHPSYMASDLKEDIFSQCITGMLKVKAAEALELLNAFFKCHETETREVYLHLDEEMFRQYPKLYAAAEKAALENEQSKSEQVSYSLVYRTHVRDVIKGAQHARGGLTEEKLINSATNSTSTSTTTTTTKKQRDDVVMLSIPPGSNDAPLISVPSIPPKRRCCGFLAAPRVDRHSSLPFASFLTTYLRMASAVKQRQPIDGVSGNDNKMAGVFYVCICTRICVLCVMLLQPSLPLFFVLFLLDFGCCGVHNGFTHTNSNKTQIHQPQIHTSRCSSAHVRGIPSISGMQQDGQSSAS